MTATDILGPAGPVAKRLAGYEVRDEQIAMARAVGEALDEPRHLLVEAGTGVGKTFAYLVPAIERVVQGPARAVVSTRTIALQEQLITKDLPFLQSVLPWSFTAELVKGRSNYLGLRRLAIASGKRQQLLPGTTQGNDLWRIEDWAYKTTDGSLADMDFKPPHALWERVRSEHDNCMGRRCPHYEPCFYQRARRRAKEAQLLVVNHALFFADLALRRKGHGLLPDYDHVILDEAHAVEQVAADHFGVSVSDRQVHVLLNALSNERTGRGLLSPKRLASAARHVDPVRRGVSAFFDALHNFNARRMSAGGRITEPPPVANTLAPLLRELASAIDNLDVDTLDFTERFELRSHADRARRLAGAVDLLHAVEQDDWVYWIEASPRRVELKAKPIDVAPALREVLFDEVPGIVLSSATLTTGGGDGFAYIRGRLGLDDCRELQLGSPFDYATQMTVRVEHRMPDPGDNGAFLGAACDALTQQIRASDGRALVLFTSYQMLNACAQSLRPVLEAMGITLLVHGSHQPTGVLLERFRQDERSVLFGTDSFWEGVDVPGPALTTVIIVKLPFASPGRADVQARIDYIKHNGGVPFMEFQLPEAVLKFKQAVGRLIRTRTDCGTVLILDPRVTSKSYGRRFLTALPPCNVQR